ncbi:MFS transporter [Tessaracoccus palaemonis]|uniref:MFS transporter n=1 Tax=Tessaracoccus palaemonis TaxID=2829499 RepID=A0ABX8SK58_9ACTN|nr:MFS transporter [Tessaracoccus palaemonis]QXT63731.1 MFS transporter [Tessaracoccus palaemonis]
MSEAAGAVQANEALFVEAVPTHDQAPTTPEPAAGYLPPEYPQNYRRTIALVLIAAAGMYIMMLTLSTALSLRIASVAPEGKEAALSLAVSFGALLQLVGVPLGGALSDRTVGRFGRRRPWIVGMLAIALVAMAVIGTTTVVPLIVGAYVIGITCAQVGFSSYSVITVEGVPDNMRGKVMGMMGMFGALAMSAGSYLAAALVGMPFFLMTAPVLLAIVCSLPLLIGYRDPAKSREDVPPLKLASLFSGLIVNPRKHPDFGWVWLSRFLAGVAMTGLFTYFIYFMMDGLGLEIAQAGANAGLLSLLSAPVSVVFFTASGWLSDKLGRRKPFVVAAALFMAAALVIAGTATTFAQFIVAWLLFAVGQAMYLTVDLVLCAAVLPDARDAGKDMGVFQLALSIPAIIVPLVAPAVLAIGGGHNYLLLWGLCAALCALGALAVLKVKGVR